METAANPYASPQEVSAVPRQLAGRQKIRKRLFQPGIVTLFFGILVSLIVAIRLPPYMMEEGAKNHNQFDAYKITVSYLTMIGLSSLFCIYGGVQIMRVRQYPVCILAAMVMFIPCISPVPVLGVVIGGWTLIAHLLKDTRAAFAEGD